MTLRHQILLHLVILCLVMVIGAYMAYVVQQIAQQIYLQSDIGTFSPHEATIVYDRNGKVITRLFLENRELLRFDEIPPLVKQVFTSVEDHTFYEHHGFSLRGMARAALVDIRAGHIVEGGSTITQQLAKNLIGRMERTYSRYFTTLLLALEIERRMTKDEILEKYLNQIYFGEGLYGIKSAARYYFDKDLGELTLMECAVLASIPKNPARYSPYGNREACFDRAAVVLNRMVELGEITAEEREAALAQEINLGRQEMLEVENLAPYFIEYIKSDLLEIFGKERLFAGGLRIYTTLDLGYQQIADEELRTLLNDEGLGDFDLQGAVVVIDPRTGYILAMSGGRDFSESKYNRAVQAQRQPGSCFKPFVYLTALERGYTQATILEDLPIVMESGGREWTPRNYSGDYSGAMTLRQALEKSENIPTINLAGKVGLDAIISTARRMGIRSPLPAVQSMVIGSVEVNLLELTSAYGVIANRGVRCDPVGVRYVTDGEGHLVNEITDEEGNPLRAISWEREREAVVSPQYAYLIADIMRGVMTRGTAARSNLDRPCAGKTGTTDDYRSVWFVGFTPDIVTGVYAGNDDNLELPILHGRRATGSSFPAPVWKRIMQRIMADRPVAEFSVPANIVFRDICSESGQLVGPACEKTEKMAFLGGTEPMDICSVCQQSAYVPY